MTQQAFNFDAGPSKGTLNAIVLGILRAGDWWTPYALCENLRGWHHIMVSDSCITARLRDLRKPRYGAHIIEKRKRENSNAYEYRLKEGA